MLLSGRPTRRNSPSCLPFSSVWTISDRVRSGPLDPPRAFEPWQKPHCEVISCWPRSTAAGSAAGVSACCCAAGATAATTKSAKIENIGDFMIDSLAGPTFFYRAGAPRHPNAAAALGTPPPPAPLLGAFAPRNGSRLSHTLPKNRDLTYSVTAMQIIRQSKTYDVCIVGSGAGGGMAAKVLCDAGADVLMLEAGGPWDVEKASKMSAWAYDSPGRGAATPDRPFGEFDGCSGGWDVTGEPYTQAPGERFDWFRARMVGGRTNHWGRISLRMGPDDFKGRSLDGVGDDWPIGYDDIKPYYDKLDRLVGIFGSNEGIRNEPDGVFLPPPKPRCYELMIKQAADTLRITCIPSRLSILTKPLNGRAACHYCGQCGRGCATHSNFSSPSVLLAPALKTGRLRIITNAMAREVTTDESGMATGVSYVNTKDRRDYAVRARIVVLAASACESARLLLNSRSPRFPNGLANSSGVVGKYLTDSTGLSVSGFIPKLANGVPHNEDGVA